MDGFSEALAGLFGEDKGKRAYFMFTDLGYSNDYAAQEVVFVVGASGKAIRGIQDLAAMVGKTDGLYSMDLRLPPGITLDWLDADSLMDANPEFFEGGKPVPVSDPEALREKFPSDFRGLGSLGIGAWSMSVNLDHKHSAERYTLDLDIGEFAKMFGDALKQERKKTPRP